MKPFNLEEAKAGKKVVTRCGYPVHIKSFNFAGGTTGFPILAVVERPEHKGGKVLLTYTNDGKHIASNTSFADLRMVDEDQQEEKEMSSTNTGEQLEQYTMTDEALSLLGIDEGSSLVIIPQSLYAPEVPKGDDDTVIVCEAEKYDSTKIVSFSNYGKYWWWINKSSMQKKESIPQQDEANCPIDSTPSAVQEPSVSESALAVQIGGSHYKDMPIQPIEYAFKNKLNPLQFNVVKYVSRYANKNGKKDLEKAIHCLQLLIEMEYGNE